MPLYIDSTNNQVYKIADYTKTEEWQAVFGFTKVEQSTTTPWNCTESKTWDFNDNNIEGDYSVTIKMTVMLDDEESYSKTTTISLKSSDSTWKLYTILDVADTAYMYCTPSLNNQILTLSFRGGGHKSTAPSMQYIAKVTVIAPNLYNRTDKLKITDVVIDKGELNECAINNLTVTKSTINSPTITKGTIEKATITDSSFAGNINNRSTYFKGFQLQSLVFEASYSHTYNYIFNNKTTTWAINCVKPNIKATGILTITTGQFWLVSVNSGVPEWITGEKTYEQLPSESMSIYVLMVCSL